MALSLQIQRTISTHILEIDRQIEAIRAEAEQMGIPAEELKYTDGKYVMPELLLAKSNAVLALVTSEPPRKK